MIIHGNTKLGWRIRDEYLCRKGMNYKGKFIKRKGGVFNAKDYISKWSDRKLAYYFSLVKGDS